MTVIKEDVVSDVIPAKAGIHLIRTRPWIPAFAGMTIEAGGEI